MQMKLSLVLIVLIDHYFVLLAWRRWPWKLMTYVGGDTIDRPRRLSAIL